MLAGDQAIVHNFSVAWAEEDRDPDLYRRQCHGGNLQEWRDQAGSVRPILLPEHIESKTGRTQLVEADNGG